jgi:hypothetical protein
MQKRGKKGLSTIVVTLIMIVLALVAVGVVWLVVNNLIKGQSEQVGTDKITFDALIENVVLTNSTNNVSLTVQRNVGAGNMKGMKFYFYNSTGVEVRTEYVIINELVSRKFSFNLNMPLSNLMKISIVPIFNTKEGKDELGNVADTYDVKQGIHIEVPQNQTCTPTNCSALGYNCGNWSNGCNATLNCGSCSTGYNCNSGICTVVSNNSNNNSKGKIGINVGGVDYYSSELMFVDVMKYGGSWVTSSIRGEFNSGLSDYVPSDENGYPLRIPYQYNSTETVTSMGTLTLREISGNHYPAGDYTVLYDGEGELSFDFASSVISSQPGRMIIRVLNTTGDGVFMRIIRSNESNHIRNIRIIMPGFENNYASQIFYPTFLTRLQNFSTLRFMDTMKTNNNPLTTWENRTTLTYYTQSKDVGIAPEYIIMISNRLHENAWINIPAKADDNYIRNLARMFNSQLDPNLKVYLEYSNELWNGGFSQAEYAGQKGCDLNIIPCSGAYTFGHVVIYQAKRSADIFRIFEEEFDDDSRLVKVLATQVVNYGVSEGLVKYFNNISVNPYRVKADALAGALYFAGTANSIGEEGLINTITVSEILDRVDAGVDEILTHISWNKDFTDANNISFIQYEAGQHLVPGDAYQDNVVLIDKLTAANRDPRMGQLYKKYLDGWFNQNPNGLIMMYSYVSPPGRYGFWGALEYQDQPISEAPKYKAIMEYIENM